MQLIEINSQPTMSSREMADLTEKRHDSVKRTIETLESNGLISKPQIVDGPKSANGVVEKYYLVGKRDSYVVVAQLSPEFTARLVDRWQELEANQAPAFALPKTMAEALRLAADQAEQLEAQRPAVEFVNRYTTATTGTKGFREVCKLLKVNEAEFRTWLIESKIMYRLGTKLTGYQNHIDAGRFEVKAGEKNGHAYNNCKFTTKGITWVAGEWAKHQIVSKQ